jgi:hypothetical protein
VGGGLLKAVADVADSTVLRVVHKSNCVTVSFDSRTHQKLCLLIEFRLWTSPDVGWQLSAVNIQTVGFCSDVGSFTNVHVP